MPNPIPNEPKIYHIVHVDRLASIIAGGLWCDAEVVRRAPPGTTIGMNAIKQRRLKELTLASHPGLFVGECVPFYFCPRSIMLYLIYQGNHPEVFGVITRWGRAQGLTLLGIAHTHIAGVPVDLSPSDRTRSVQVPGMLAVVIGNGGLDKVFADWGWFVYETDDYEIIPRVDLLSRIRIAEGNHVQVFKADSSGIVPLNANS
jgi:hypothetical protein